MFKIARKNKKELISSTATMKKSNEISMAKLTQGLSLNQMQLLAYAIYSTQKDSEKNSFLKVDFEKRFNLDEYRRKPANTDTKKLYELGFATVDLERDYFDYLRVFQRITYYKGKFTFKWTDDMLPHILELKDNYVTTDLSITSQFKSSFSWTLYEYIKAHYGNWSKELDKTTVMRLFEVEDVISYQKNTGLLKVKVIDTAIKEINEHTELEVWYTELRKGRAITGFKFHWSTGNQIAGATTKQVKLLKEIHDEVDKNVLDYLLMKNSDLAKPLIIKIKEINAEVKKGLSVKKADEYIKESLENYKQLEHLLENDGKQRDTSIYYNWLEEIDE